MKFVKFPISVLTDSRLSANDMRVLAWLIYRSTPNPDNKCWPSIRILSEDTGEIIGEDDCSCGRLGKYFKVHGRVIDAEIRGCSDTHE